MILYRLNFPTLLRAAAACGDTSAYAISRRSGVPESSLSRWRRGKTQPGSISLLRLARAYGLAIDDLIQESDKAIKTDKLRSGGRS
ncbi:helix-turn-helix domain-containing protein [Streptomyces sp. NPDC002067]